MLLNNQHEIMQERQSIVDGVIEERENILKQSHLKLFRKLFKEKIIEH
jgi:hypothetical protein